MSHKKRVKSGIAANIMKALSLFSGLQMFNILCALVKVKFVALWIGAAGVGLFGIYNSSIETIQTLTGLGLRNSAVRDVAQASRSGASILARCVALVRKWSRLAGLIGAVAMSALSPLLSEILFDDISHWWAFTLIAAAMLFNAIYEGEQSILQGTQRLGKLGKVVFWASLGGLMVSIPMFRFLGELSVPLSIVAYSLAAVTSAAIFGFRRDKNLPRPSVKLSEGKGFVKLGACIAIAAFMSNIATVAFLGYLNRITSIETVGYYQAGTTIVVRYVGLLFGAIGVELYPRLSANSHSARRLSLFVSHEIILLLLVLIPCLLIFMPLRGLAVELLYTKGFEVIVPFISWAIVGTIFRAVAVCIATTILARGDGKVYMITESLDAVIGFALNVVLYNKFGLVGLGYAYILWYLIYCLMVWIVYRFRYGLHLRKDSVLLAIVAILTAIAAMFLADILPLYLSLPISLLLSLLPLSRLYTLIRH